MYVYIRMMIDIVDKPQRIQKGVITLDTGEQVPYYEPASRSPRQKAALEAERLRSKDVQSYITYEDAYRLKQNLSPCAKDMLEFMCLNMDRDNAIIMDVSNRTKFCFGSQDKDGTQKYQESTAYKAIRELRKTELIREISELHYIVNPRYFFNSTSVHRHQRALSYQIAYEQTIEDKPD